MNPALLLRRGRTFELLIAFMSCLLLAGGIASADSDSDRSFTALITDAEGVITELTNVSFYWEEKVSETAFVPHELRQVPVRRGAGTVKVRFATIREVEVEPAPDSSLLRVTITLTNGRTGEFQLAIAGSFKGESEFGEMHIPANSIRRILFK
ncbi:MAG: hypothetical protein ACE5MM_06675 [Nitrospiraceae bacterium]